MSDGQPTSYLSVQNFWKYQNADAWKKAKSHPPWFKHYVHRDRELDRLPLPTRLLFFELLGAATRYSNVLEADLNWLSSETRIGTEQIAESLPLLLKGGWLSQTSSPRRSRKPSRGNLPDSGAKEVDVDVKDFKNPRPPAKLLCTGGEGCSLKFDSQAELDKHLDVVHWITAPSPAD